MNKHNKQHPAQLMKTSCVKVFFSLCFLSFCVLSDSLLRRQTTRWNSRKLSVETWDTVGTRRVEQTFDTITEKIWRFISHKCNLWSFCLDSTSSSSFILFLLPLTDSPVVSHPAVLHQLLTCSALSKHSGSFPSLPAARLLRPHF